METIATWCMFVISGSRMRGDGVINGDGVEGAAAATRQYE
jgi:hypothetical protein